MTTKLGDHILAIRAASRWPEAPDFARQLGMSLGGLKKLEGGFRILPVQLVEEIITLTRLKEEPAQLLRLLRDEAKKASMEWSSKSEVPSGTVPVDVDKLTERVHLEVLYILRVAGEKIGTKTTDVLKKRIAIILKTALEK